MSLNLLKNFEINTLNLSISLNNLKNDEMKIATETYQFTDSLKENATRSYTRNQSKL